MDQAGRCRRVARGRADQPCLWTTLAEANVVRNYHSASALLPNGCVLTAGGGVPGGEDAPEANFNAEVFYPPYLFRSGDGHAQLADRPRMVSISDDHLGYDKRLEIEMADRRAIARVSFLGLNSTTHSFDMGQRFVPADFSQDGELLTLTTPFDSSIAPPGYYQVIPVDTEGVPARGFIIEVE